MPRWEVLRLEPPHLGLCALVHLVNELSHVRKPIGARMCGLRRRCHRTTGALPPRHPVSAGGSATGSAAPVPVVYGVAGGSTCAGSGEFRALVRRITVAEQRPRSGPT